MHSRFNHSQSVAVENPNRVLCHLRTVLTHAAGNVVRVALQVGVAGGVGVGGKPAVQVLHGRLQLARVTASGGGRFRVQRPAGSRRIGCQVK